METVRLLCSTSSHHLCPFDLVLSSKMLDRSNFLVDLVSDSHLSRLSLVFYLLYIYTSMHLYFFTSILLYFLPSHLLLFYDAVLHENASAHSRMISFIRLEASYDLLTPVMIFQQQGVIYSSIPLHIYTSIHLYLYTSTHVYLLLSTRL